MENDMEISRECGEVKMFSFRSFIDREQPILFVCLIVHSFSKLPFIFPLFRSFFLYFVHFSSISFIFPLFRLFPHRSVTYVHVSKDKFEIKSLGQY